MSNRLAQESSLYLRQHADNPVDWYPWGADALSRAREEDRPILLSIGYSSCHWCHVMERESFEDPTIARVMNEGFVNVKVDREERPDVDSIYMRAVQALTGHGGWPLTVFLTPGGEPFYGGTYFPPEPRQGMPSFRQVLEATRAAWVDRADEVREAATQIRDILERSTSEPAAPADSEQPGVDRDLLDAAAGALLAQFDHEHGGFGRAPKFPQPMALDFLLEYHAFTEGTSAAGPEGTAESSRDSANSGPRTPGAPGPGEALSAALYSLYGMARGGIRDHLGGGFHRYAVDARWHVPHFEKMLYDNALLAGVYLRGHQLSGDDTLAQVCREVLDDVLEDFRSPEGGFYTARDADSEGEEGTFYLWTPAQVSEVLSDADAALFCRCYDVTEVGNFEGRNILHLPRDLQQLSRTEGIPAPELEVRLAAMRQALKQARARREHPARDEKILAGWNALALRSFAEAGAALDEPRYLEAAQTGAAWLMAALRPDGRLLHQVPESDTRIPAFLEDVAGLGNALLSLHEATLNPRWLHEAVALDREVEDRFRDPDTGLLYDTPADGEALVVRPREVTDTPVPAGSSLAAELRLRLARLLGDVERATAAHALVARESAALTRMPSGFGRLLCVAQRWLHPSVEIAILGPSDDPATRALLREAHRPFIPGRVLTGTDDVASYPEPTPLLENRGPIQDRPAAFVCRDFTCRAPVTEPEALAHDLVGPG
jgi:uncharacterized protein